MFSLIGAGGSSGLCTPPFMFYTVGETIYLIDGSALDGPVLLFVALGFAVVLSSFGAGDFLYFRGHTFGSTVVSGSVLLLGVGIAIIPFAAEAEPLHTMWWDRVVLLYAANESSGVEAVTVEKQQWHIDTWAEICSM